MSKGFTKEDVILNKKEALKSLNKLLESYINNPTEKHLKKAYLISYWLKNYTQYINFEERFEPTKNIAYKRGDIVKLNFGFNIGSEYGGLHYAVVLDNHNNHNSPVLTVIPLTSVKEGKDIHNNNVALGNELYKSLKLKYDTISKTLKEEQQYLDKIEYEISQMKEGSIALVSQITTVSKIRVFDPRNPKDVLSGISLSGESMEKINQKVKELYVF